MSGKYRSVRAGVRARKRAIRAAAARRAAALCRDWLYCSGACVDAPYDAEMEAAFEALGPEAAHDPWVVGWGLDSKVEEADVVEERLAGGFDVIPDRSADLSRLDNDLAALGMLAQSIGVRRTAVEAARERAAKKRALKSERVADRRARRNKERSRGRQGLRAPAAGSSKKKKTAKKGGIVLADDWRMEYDARFGRGSSGRRRGSSSGEDSGEDSGDGSTARYSARPYGRTHAHSSARERPRPRGPRPAAAAAAAVAVHKRDCVFEDAQLYGLLEELLPCVDAFDWSTFLATRATGVSEADAFLTAIDSSLHRLARAPPPVAMFACPIGCGASFEEGSDELAEHVARCVRPPSPPPAMPCPVCAANLSSMAGAEQMAHIDACLSAGARAEEARAEEVFVHLAPQHCPIGCGYRFPLGASEAEMERHVTACLAAEEAEEAEQAAAVGAPVEPAVCPVCSKPFPPGIVSAMDMEKHVEDCLSKSFIDAM